MNYIKQFEDLYWEFFARHTSWETSTKPIILYKDWLFVSLDAAFNRDGGLDGVNQLVYKIHELGRDQKIFFLNTDGVNLITSGSINVIKFVIETLNLDKSSCVVMSRQPITLDRATILFSSDIKHWSYPCYKYVKDVPIPTEPFIKKFAVWFNRGTFYRLQITRLLKTYYENDSYISFNASKMMEQYKYEYLFDNDIKWAEQNVPIRLPWDNAFQPVKGPITENNYTLEDMVDADRHRYQDYFMEIIAEGEILLPGWITEKTVKNLYIGKPFIVFAGPGILAKIKSFGFRTFSPWIDESYDQIENNYLRLEAIKKEIDRIAALSYTELEQLHKEILPILEHNRIR